jgi:hypothetical protein
MVVLNQLHVSDLWDMEDTIILCLPANKAVFRDKRRNILTVVPTPSYLNLIFV